MPQIHPTALVDPKAQIGEGVNVGPYCTIGAGSVIGAKTCIMSHVVIDGRVTIGERNHIYPGTCIGFPPQSKPAVTGSFIVIGNDNIFREHVTIHTGLKETGTLIGNNNFLMATSHVGHDARVENNVTMANSVALGGHVVVEDGAVLGGLAAVHQYCRIGKLAMVGGLTKPTQDILPFSMVEGRPARLLGMNVTGLKRQGYDSQTLRDVRRAMLLLRSRQKPLKELLVSLRAEFSHSAEIEYLVRFIEASKRGVARRYNDRSGDSDS